jgi:GT2 family glycosyltransferase
MLKKDFIKVAVIIPHFNDEQRLQTCLKALSEQTLSNHSFHIYVVDNGSERLPKLLTSKFNNVTLLLENKQGSYNARNKGINAVDASYYAFTDSDCIPDKLWLESGIVDLELKKLDAIGGPIELFCQTIGKPTAIEIIDICFAFDQKTYIFEKHYSPTANLIIKKETLNKVGLFNGALMSGGDAEWGLRLFNAGGKLDYCEDTKIYHPARYSLEEYLTKKRRTTHGNWVRRHSDKNIKKHTGFGGMLTLIIPPVKRFKEIFSSFPEVNLSGKILASWYLYFGKLYVAYHYTLCRFGLIKKPERR